MSRHVWEKADLVLRDDVINRCCVIHEIGAQGAIVAPGKRPAETDDDSSRRSTYYAPLSSKTSRAFGRTGVGSGARINQQRPPFAASSNAGHRRVRGRSSPGHAGRSQTASSLRSPATHLASRYNRRFQRPLIAAQVSFAMMRSTSAFLGSEQPESLQQVTATIVVGCIKQGRTCRQTSPENRWPAITSFTGVRHRRRK